VAAPSEAVVYTFGKVGSTAVAAALNRAGILTHDIHSLDPAVLKRQARAALARDTFPPHHVSLSMVLRERLRRRPPHLWFISLVRDPVAVRISSFFENLPYRSDGLGLDSPAEDLIDGFLAEVRLDYQLGWFDREYRDQLGLDIAALPFDREARVSVYPQERLVLMRADCPDEAKSGALGRVFGCDVTVARGNVGAEKPYAEAYARAREAIRFPGQRLAPVYGSAHVRQFWTEAEIDRMRAAWTAHP
jgi:hypothetical protein